MARYLYAREMCPVIKTEEGEKGSFRFLGLYAKNREEWAITDLAGALSGITVVTLYDTLGKDSIEYILEQTSMKTVFC